MSEQLAITKQKLSDFLRDLEAAESAEEKLRRKRCIIAARSEYENDEVQIDNNAALSETDEAGTWVMAWVWVTDDEIAAAVTSEDRKLQEIWYVQSMEGENSMFGPNNYEAAKDIADRINGRIINGITARLINEPEKSDV